MPDDQPLPGDPHHQSLLRTIVEAYTDDARVRAVVVFGSLGRGKWDAYSDLDLAIVVHDDTHVDLPAELQRLEAALTAGGAPVLFRAAAGDAGYLALDSLTGIAVDFHPLAATSPYLLDGCIVLWGALEATTIQDAARLNEPAATPLDREVHRALWLALGVDIPLQRRQFWPALKSLTKLRDALMGIYAVSRGGQRHDAFFEATAREELQTKLGHTLPSFFPDSPAASNAALSRALLALLDLLEFDLGELSNHTLQLGAGERQFIHRLRARQEGLKTE